MPGNLYEIARDATPSNGEAFEPILAGPGSLLVERIVSNGQATPPGQWYDQDHDEWVAVLRGEAALAFDDGHETALKAGDHAFLPSHKRHRVTRTSSPCVWLAVHGQNLSPAGPTPSGDKNQGGSRDGSD